MQEKLKKEKNEKIWPTGVKRSVDYPIISIHRHFENLAQRNADLPYLSLLGIEFSYQEVDELSSRFAAALQAQGVQKGDHVGLFMPNLPQYVIGFFGILKAGAVVVPISPLYGEVDLKETLINTDVKAVVILDILYPTLKPALEEATNIQLVIKTALGDILSPIKRFLAKLIGKLPKSPKIPEAKDFYELIDAHEPLAKSVDVDPKKDIAVIGLTGGTTGIPKGAMLSHENIVSNLYAAREWASVVQPHGTHKKFLGAVPFFHIIGLTAVMIVTAHFDSTVYLVPDPRKFDMILKLIDEENINYFHGVPTLFRALLKHPDIEKYDLSSLEIILSGAAPLPAQLGKELEEKTGAVVCEAYGLTETSPIVAANPFEKAKRRFGTIGIPFVNTEIKLLDLDKGNEVGIGQVGEICVKGPQVMQGYYKRPDETDQVLIDGYLHTGDIGYMNEEGFITLVNRKKDMINASGFKIFPSELENIVYDHFPEIEEAVVIGTPDEYRGETVKFIAVIKEGAHMTADKLKAFFREKVAKYKVPKIYEFRKELPKTGVGKIDRKELRKQEEKQRKRVKTT